MEDIKQDLAKIIDTVKELADHSKKQSQEIISLKQQLAEAKENSEVWYRRYPKEAKLDDDVLCSGCGRYLPHRCICDRLTRGRRDSRDV